MWPGSNLMAFRSDILRLLSGQPIIWWQEFLGNYIASHNLQYEYISISYNLRISEIKENLTGLTSTFTIQVDVLR